MPLYFHLITPEDKETIHVIAQWLYQEWEIPAEKVFAKIASPENIFHLVLKDENQILATGGLHASVSISDLTPEFKSYSPWLAWVYTDPEFRGKGYGEMICKKVQKMSKEMGYNKIYLYTNSAEKLYTRLGWQAIQRFHHREKDNVVMSLGIK